MKYCKVNNTWKEITAAYKKDNGVWVVLTDAQLLEYLNSHIFKYGGNETGLIVHTLMIGGASNAVGESGTYMAIYDGNVVTENVVWSVASGSSYATISQNGELTILEGASSSPVIISIQYSGLTAIKNLNVTYDVGTTSETETETETETNESGQTITTTTTTTTTTDASGNTTVTETVTQIVENEDGSLSSIEQETETTPDGATISNSTVVNYDENGNVTGSQTSKSVENQDGSSTSTTTNFDENGNATDTTNTSGDTSGNINTQQVEYDESGTPVVTSYDIDTSGSDGEGQEIEGNGINTEFIPFKFSSQGFVINFDFEAAMDLQPRPPLTEDTEDTGTNYLYTILGAKTTAKVGNIWPGFEIRITIPKSGTPDYTNSSKCFIQFNRTFSGETSTTRTNFTSGHCVNNVYHLTIIYNPSESTTFKVRNNVINANIQTSNKYLQDNVDLDLTIGYSIDHNGNEIRHSNIVIHDFNVSKLISGATITQPLISCTNNVVTISCAVQGAKIYYKTSTDEKYDLYKSPIAITANTTFNAYTIYQDKVSSVKTQSCEYFDGTPNVPVITCDGEYVTITCSTQDASVYYKFGQNSEFVQYNSPVVINENTTVYAYSVLSGVSSTTVSENCNVLVVADPVILCNGEYVSITCATQDATVHYKLNQNAEYSTYSGPIEISADTMVYAYATLRSKSSTTVSEFCEYNNVIEVSSPVISCVFNEVSITCDTVGATIYYRLNETGSYSEYTAPIAISADTIVEAYAELGNNISSTVSETCIYNIHDYSQDYLTFDVLSGGTIAWKALGSGYNKAIEYSLNNGQWTSISATSNGTTIAVQAGDKVRFKGSNSTYAGSKSNYDGFEGGTAYFNIEGNINSLLYGDNFASTSALTNSTYQFCSIFKKAHVVSAENLILPATTLKNYCYRAMFSYCEDLVIAPALPATTLAQGCYWYMFERCSITMAPDLNAATIPAEGYGYMFTNCSNLNYIKCLATTKSASKCVEGWVTNVAAQGTFVKNSNTTWSTGISGIPTGWVSLDDGMTAVSEPTINCDGEEVTIECETSGATIYYRLNETGGYATYTSPISISADTTVQAYAVLSGVSSTTITQDNYYVSNIPLEASNRNLNNWRYNDEFIEVPYSINALNGHSSSYSKGSYNFETTFVLRNVQPTYLWFQHADQSADIYVDDVKVTTHWGGYNAFYTDISNFVHSGTNRVKVTLCNTTRNTLAPADGDFNFNATLGYVKLLTSPVLPSMQYGYDGFHITSDVAISSATINVRTTVPSGATLTCSISGESCNYSVSGNSDGQEMVFTTTIQNPRLWDGVNDPYLYNVRMDIYSGETLYHTFERGYGLRFYNYVINETISGETYTGFLLNGKPYALRGVCMHSDIDGKANALTRTDINNDFNLIQELGCNFIRLAHYPHPKEVYDKCDELGIIVQTEVPCVKKFQMTMPDDYYNHLYIQYEDMVRQHYNHPSIMFWGLFNEATTDNSTSAKTKLEAYRTFIKDIDPERWVGYVVSHSYSNPSSVMGNPNMDWFGGNIYVGWYINNGTNGELTNNPTTELNKRINNIINTLHKPYAYSEYGCGGNQSCHSETPLETTQKGNYARHDIEYMMWLHEGHIAAIKNLPQLLFTGEWQLFDIAVSSRAEGYKVCLDGETVTDDNSYKYLNDKGLVMRDHVTKKDTFYLYKAWWSSQKFVHICGKNYTKKVDRAIKCYTNDGSTLSIYVNNSPTPAETVNVVDNIALFTSTTYQSGDTIRVQGDNTNDTFTFE